MLIASAGSAVVAVVGGIAAVTGGVLLSPLFPVGVARDADPDVGFHVDWIVAALGIAAVVMCVLAMALVAAVRATSPTRTLDARARPSAMAARIANAGVTPSVSNGVRLALERGRGRLVAPVRSAAAGSTLGVLGVVAVLVFSVNLNNLVDSRARRSGASWDFQILDQTSNTPCGAGDYGLSRTPGVAALTEVCVQNVQLGGRPVTALAYTAIKGLALSAAIVEGRSPRARDEVALGTNTLAALHAHVGSSVPVQGRDHTLRYHIVGRAVFPTLGTAQPLADGAAFTGAGYTPLFDDNLYNRFFVGSYAPGVDRLTVDRRLETVRQTTAPTPPTTPAEIDRLRQIDWLPLALTALLAAFAMLALGHGLVTSVRRRRSEFALLKTLGFKQHQVRATVAWQATTLALIGVAFGVPVGLVAGALVWDAVAAGLTVAPQTSVPVTAVAITGVAALALARVLAWWPAHAAARTRPSVAPQAE